MSVCSEQVFLSSARARTPRRNTPQHVLSSEEQASFLKRFSLRELSGRQPRRATASSRHLAHAIFVRRPAGQPSRNACKRAARVLSPPPKTRCRFPFEHQTTKHPKATSYATPSKEPVPALKDPQKQSSDQDHRSAPPRASFVHLRRGSKRKSAHARRQPPVTSDGRPAAPTTLKKSPGPRRAPAPRAGQPKGARRQ